MFFILPHLNSQTARSICEKYRELTDFESLEISSTIKIINAKGKERIREVVNASKQFGKTKKTIIKFISPPDVKGIAMLIFDQEYEEDMMWIYMPALGKTRRIVSSEKSSNFMGSEFTNANMSKPNMNDFDYKFLSSESHNEKICWKIEAVWIHENNDLGYSKQIKWIEKSTNLCCKVEYFDKKNNLYKTLLFEDYQKQTNGKHMALLMLMENHKNKRKSQIQITEVQLTTDIAETSFSPNILDKW
jgi:hypothetical protein